MTRDLETVWASLAPRTVLDTSVLIGAVGPGELECAISVASLAALHFGVLVTADADERARRAQRLGVVDDLVDVSSP